MLTLYFEIDNRKLMGLSEIQLSVKFQCFYADKRENILAYSNVYCIYLWFWILSCNCLHHRTFRKMDATYFRPGDTCCLAV